MASSKCRSRAPLAGARQWHFTADQIKVQAPRGMTLVTKSFPWVLALWFVRKLIVLATLSFAMWDLLPPLWPCWFLFVVFLTAGCVGTIRGATVPFPGESVVHPVGLVLQSNNNYSFSLLDIKEKYFSPILYAWGKWGGTKSWSDLPMVWETDWWQSKKKKCQI